MTGGAKNVTDAAVATSANAATADATSVNAAAAADATSVNAATAADETEGKLGTIAAALTSAINAGALATGNDSLAAQYTIREATVADAQVIAWQRVSVFRDMGVLDEAISSDMEIASARRIAELIEQKSYFGWFVEAEGEIVAGAGLQLRELLPRPKDPLGGLEAYVVNVYTDLDHRRKGLARALMYAIMSWCRVRSIRSVTLRASDDGRKLYDTLGFYQTNEMGYDIDLELVP